MEVSIQQHAITCINFKILRDGIFDYGLRNDKPSQRVTSSIIAAVRSVLQPVLLRVTLYEGLSMNNPHSNEFYRDYLALVQGFES